MPAQKRQIWSLLRHRVLECDDRQRIADRGEYDEDWRRVLEPSEHGLVLPERRDARLGRRGLSRCSVVVVDAGVSHRGTVPVGRRVRRLVIVFPGTCRVHVRAAVE